MSKRKSITIYPDALVPSLKKGSLELSPRAEEELNNLLLAREAIEQILERAKYMFEEAMQKANVNSIEHGDIKVTRSVTGRRFALDPGKPVAPEFIQIVNYQSVDTKKVDAYLETKGKLPIGVIENARKSSVKIEQIK